MKRLKISLSVMALMMGLGGAFANKIAKMPKANEQTYDWTDEREGQSQHLINKTISEAQSTYDCLSTSVDLCATGKADGMEDVHIFRTL